MWPCSLLHQPRLSTGSHLSLSVPQGASPLLPQDIHTPLCDCLHDPETEDISSPFSRTCFHHSWLLFPSKHISLFTPEIHLLVFCLFSVSPTSKAVP